MTGQEELTTGNCASNYILATHNGLETNQKLPNPILLIKSSGTLRFKWITRSKPEDWI